MRLLELLQKYSKNHSHLDFSHNPEHWLFSNPKQKDKITIFFRCLHYLPRFHCLNWFHFQIIYEMNYQKPLIPATFDTLRLRNQQSSSVQAKSLDLQHYEDSQCQSCSWKCSFWHCAHWLWGNFYYTWTHSLRRSVTLKHYLLIASFYSLSSHP